MTGKLTIRDIAKHAGVGTTTVSRVLNEHPYVSEDKRQRVLQAIQELDYRPSFSARWLRGTNSGLIGFLTDEVAITPYAVDIIRGAQEAAWKQGNVLLVVNAGDDLQSTESAVEFLLERQVEGIIYAAMFHREVQLPENIYQVRTVLANCYVKDRSLPSAVPDEVEGGYNATRALLEKGHRRIALINVRPPAVDATEGRLMGYKRALADFDVPFDPALVKDHSLKSELNYRTTLELLSMENPPTGFFCGNDRTAMGCYTAILERGLSIPDDIGVVGFDNQLDIAVGLIPSLTTIELPHYEMGMWALEHLCDDPYEIGESAIQKLIPCPLVSRYSV